ncbi:MAG: epoxyqueuosine reductase QueH [Candidatus Izemoplasmatales bacterium]
MKLLLHICCAPCSVMCISKLREDGIDVTGYWYNPNIHPFTEYQNRLAALKGYSELINLPVIYNDFYGLRLFVKLIDGRMDDRCKSCYEERLTAVALEAKKLGYDAFSTTLLISPYQQHETLRLVAERVAAKIKIPFYYVDFRNYFREGQQIARKLPLYMQKYCGCIFSEEERYLGKK